MVRPTDEIKNPTVEDKDNKQILDNFPSKQNELDTVLDDTENIPKENAIDYINYEYVPDNGLIDNNIIPNDIGASFANIVQATVVETSARSVRDRGIGSM